MNTYIALVDVVTEKRYRVSIDANSAEEAQKILMNSDYSTFEVTSDSNNVSFDITLSRD